MASSTSPLRSLLLFSTLLFLLFFISHTNAQLAASSSSRPHGVILPVTKDYVTLQYLTNIRQRTPLVPIDLVVDLSGEYLWVDCEQDYFSSSYSPALCQSAQCKLSRSRTCGDCYSPARPGCNNNTCGAFPSNTVTQFATSGEFASDVISLQSTDGSSAGQNVTVRRLVFGCGSTSILNGLAKGVKGMAGLGNSPVSLPSQFAAAFRFPRKFALCLSAGKGVIFFGDGPYTMQPGIELSQSLSYTPLINSTVSSSELSPEPEPSTEYYIGVKSIKVDGENVPLNQNLLSFNKESGVGGTKISTVNPYTVMETSIYNAFANVFIKKAAAMNLSRVASVAPFGACFGMANLTFTITGFNVPRVDLVMENKGVTWSFYGSNSVVQARSNVFCLAFVDGGSEPRTSIVIGGYQLEQHLLQFDLPRSRLGFSSTLLLRETSCSNFDFTTKGQSLQAS